MSEIPVIQRQTPMARKKRQGNGLALLCFALGISVALVLLATPIVPTMLSKFIADEEIDLQDESIEVLQRRLSRVGKLDPVQAELLTKELARVHRYEQQLRKRAAALDAVLKDALELDYNQFGKVEPLQESKLNGKNNDMGIGGGKEPVSPIVKLPSRSKAAKKRAGKVEHSDLVNLMEYQTEQLSHLPLGAPVNARVSSNYGMRRSPFSRRHRMHHGIDFSVDRRTTVRATGDGVVKEAGYIGAYGRTVVIDHGNGYETLYGHLQKVSVKVGTTVCRGERIGLAGSTGRSTGPHVHYEVRLDGKPTNPKTLVELASFLSLI